MTPAEARKIRTKCSGLAPNIAGNPHPLEGKSVREWVAEARAGWPKAPPAPKDPIAAAQKVLLKSPGVHYEQTELS
jgi:hypothetical protein